MGYKWAYEEARMGRSRVLIVGEDRAATRRLAAFLAARGLAVERTAALPGPGPELAGRCPVIVLATGREEEVAPGLRGLAAGPSRPAVIVLTETARPRPLLTLLGEGIIDQVANPSSELGVYSAVRSSLELRRLAEENEACRRSLALSRAERAKNVRRAMALEEIYDATLENLMTALDLRDVETFGHSRTVAKYSQVLAGLLGITDEKVLDNIRKGALLHDVGKIAIPDAILKKPGRLSEEEWKKVRLHPALGYGLVKEIKLVREAGNIILRHHEKFDGSGYPEGLRGKDIPLEARIFALADALDAITSHRPYRKERDFAAARDEIRRHEGTQFDPAVVAAFEKLSLSRWERIRFETTRLLPSVFEYHKLASRT